MQFRNIESQLVTNKAGGLAYTQSDEYAFVCLLLTTLLKDKYSESASVQFKRLKKYARALDPIFLAKATYYARNEHGIRSATHVIAGELIDRLKGNEEAYKIIATLVRRPDDMLEIVSYYRAVKGKKLPALLRKSMKEALRKFDEYQLAKYKASNSSFKMVDLFNLIHPKPSTLQAETYRKLIKGELANTETWEAKISAAGKDVDTKKESWIELVKSKKIGYFALLRNLRNIVQYAPEVTMQAAEMLTDEKLIKNSLVLPFRFHTAVNELVQIPGFHAQVMVQAIANAADISLQNVPQFDGRTLIAIDCSGSMMPGYHSGKDTPLVHASIFGAALYKKNGAHVMLFDTKAKMVNPDARGTVLGLAQGIQEIAQREFGGGTDFDLIFKHNNPYDRIIILSDMQSWVSGSPPLFNAYCQRTGCNPKVHTFDLTGYGTMQFPQKNVFIYTGFSDKVLDTMAFVEQDQDALLNEIKKIDLSMLR